MKFPLAYFLTWTTYGTWLHGDLRGSFDAFGNYVPPNELRTELNNLLLTGETVILMQDQRAVVNQVIEEHCQIRGWKLHTRNARTTHVHAVVSASTDGEVVREQLKAWCSRRLSDLAELAKNSIERNAKKWWTQKGNIEMVWNDRQLESVVRYAEDQ